MTEKVVKCIPTCLLLPKPYRSFFSVVHLSMWINCDWRLAESVWCGVINQKNKCR